MSHFDIEFRIAATDDAEQRAFQGMVDTGSTYTMIAGSILREMGIRPTDTMRFELADGSIISRDIAEARVYINGRSNWTIVAFAEEATEPILGVYTLEGLRLVVDPVNERLAPVGHLRA